MHKNIIVLLALLVPAYIFAGVGPLIDVFLSNEIWTGVTVSKSDRVFVEFPHLDGSAGPRVAEVAPDGKITPYPNAAWNQWKLGDDPTNVFVRTNAVRMGAGERLWIVDTGTPKMGDAIVPGGAKLVSIDIDKNKIDRVYPLDAVTFPTSFIDDVRFHGEVAYLTDAGEPAIIVLDLKSGRGRRVLERDVSTTSRRPLVASGRQLKTPDGKPVHIHADQHEVSPDGTFYYYQPVTGPMYRIETKYMEDPSITDEILRKKAVLFFDSPSTGGTAMDDQGNIYLSDVDKRQIIKISPDGKAEEILTDKLMDWADALWLDHRGFLWMPVAQLDQMALFNECVSKVKPPLHIYKLFLGRNGFY